MLAFFLLWATGTGLQAANGQSASAEPFEVSQVEGNWQQNSVTAIVQSHDGYLWLGTYHGLVRFDGVTFTVFDSGNTPELPNGRITSLYESPDRVLWIGHETGQVTRLADGRFQSVHLGSNWAGGALQAITSDEAGDVWLMNDTGTLLRLRDGKTARTPGGASAMMIATLARTKDGRLWMASSGKVATLDQGNVVPVVFPGDQPNAIYERVFAAEEGGVWVLGNGRLRKWREGGWATEVEGFPREFGVVNLLIETRSGLLVGTQREGLYLLRSGAEPLHFTRTNGLSHDWIRALAVDQEGNCWIGTGTGFEGLRPRKVRMVSPPDGWQGFGVLSFSVHSDDTAWVGTEGGGLYRYDGQQWTVLGQAAGLKSPFIWSVLETKQQELFVGTWGGGLFRWNGARFESPGDLRNITAPVAALYEGRGGELWIGTHEGLYRYETGKLVWFAGKDKLTLPDVRTITESPDGTLWFGMSGGGLGSLRKGVLKQFRQNDGLGSDLVSCLYADPDGTLWIGTTDNGLTRLARGKFSIISAAQGLPSKIMSHIVADGIGHFWLGTQGGILRVSKSDLERCAGDQTSSVHCLSYGRAEGLSAPTCLGGFQPGACKSADGRLWFPTVKGLAVVDPANVTTNSVPPPVVIEALFVDGVASENWMHANPDVAPGSSHTLVQPATQPPVERPNELAPEIAKPLRIPPGHRRFEFHYTGLSFVAPDKVRFRRKLEGLEHDWVDAGVTRVAEYSYLPPGDYTFKVIACNNDEVWNEAGASVAFTLLPYFWQTLWFRAASIVGGAGAVAAGVLGVVRQRLRRKLEHLERQRALERERARIARDIHDDLGASLTRISMLSQSVLSEVQGQPQAAANVDQIQTTARELTRAMDEIVWAVNPKYDTLDSLAAYLGRFAQHYLSAANIRCRLNVPVQLPPVALTAEIRHNVFLAFKEALHNVVKHAQATEVCVSLELRPTGFELHVVDNGRGFHWHPANPAVAASGDSLRCAAGHGLTNMQKRMEEIGGRCDWDTAPGEGTRAKFTVMFKS
ncbi:MAG: ATP-binding protein [Verrucomicrobia bacterium]|nr:ATP-binding protein [Verrucomicrobiota bacterium]